MGHRLPGIESPRHTFSTLFGRDLSDPALRAFHKRMLADAVLNALTVRSKTGSRKVGYNAA